MLVSAPSTADVISSGYCDCLAVTFKRPKLLAYMLKYTLKVAFDGHEP